MLQKVTLLITTLAGMFVILATQSIPLEEKSLEPKRVKLLLRDIGHRLLLSANDSTTRVKPVKELSKGIYEISFENNLEFEPTTLVNIVAQRFETSGIPKYYFVEVLNCDSKEIVYSFEIAERKSQTIVPCDGRVLPFDCYSIQITLEDNKKADSKYSMFVYGSLGLAGLLVFFLWFKKGHSAKYEISNSSIKFGNLVFDKAQLKILNHLDEIPLSRKECEILSILIENFNNVTTRDELVKRVWEDQGVVVGRSLDTYISKLRKKIAVDQQLKLTNVHGVGYKLEEL